LVAVVALLAVPAVVAESAVVAWLAFVAVVALSAVLAWPALGTVPSCVTSIWCPVSDPAATFSAVTVPFARLRVVTAPFLIAAVPTLFLGSSVAAYAPPPRDTNTAMLAMTFA